jgi:hephaestin
VKINTSALSYPESNLKHAINGFLFCNMPSVEVRAGSKVRWYVMGFGSEADMHSPVFPGQSISNAGERACPGGFLC